MENVAPPGKGKRLLAIYDLMSQPYSYGDLILFQAGSLTVAEATECETVDLCVLADQPPQDENFQRLVPADARLWHFLPCLHTAQCNPRLGNIHLLTDRSHLELLAASMPPGSICWPDPGKLDRKEYLFYPIHQHLAHLFAAQGRFPRLSMPESLLQWANRFLGTHALGRVPVTISLRNNPHYHPHRNALLDEWIAFFRHCEQHLPIQFLVMCLRSEIDPRLRGLPNVVLCKDFDTTVEQELALIQASRFHVGSGSGPSIFPVFTDKPYLVVHVDMLPHIRLYGGALYRDPDGFLRYTFAGPWQRFSIEEESSGFLIREVERMLAASGEPEEDPALHCRAMAGFCATSGNPASARLFFQRAALLSPRDGDLLEAYGQFLLQQGEEATARTLLTKASVLRRVQALRSV